MRRIRGVAGHLTPLGRAVLALSLLGAAAYHWLGWQEFGLLALVGLGLVAVGLVLVCVPQPVHGTLRLDPGTTTVGHETVVEIAVTARLLPLLHPVVMLPVGGHPRLIRLPLVAPGRTRVERFAGPAPRRGVYAIGPVTHLRSDVLGLFTRSTRWAEECELLVRPAIRGLEAVEPGLISDLDGVMSDHPAASDLAFHALREYVPGDDLRHVHWRSSAKADTLLVRQYVETRRSHATVVVDDRAASYASEDEFELAVAVAASVAVRAVVDDFHVTLVCGDSFTASRDPDALLDRTCRFVLADGDLRRAAFSAASSGGASSLVVVVTGALQSDAALQLAGSEFPAEAVRLLVRADLDGPGSVGGGSGPGRFRTVAVGALDDLPGLLARAAR